MPKKKKQRKIVRAIRLTWDSLNSHLDKKSKFDKKCVKEYAFILKILCDML